MLAFRGKTAERLINQHESVIFGGWDSAVRRGNGVLVVDGGDDHTRSRGRNGRWCKAILGVVPPGLIQGPFITL
jgi:hypothetical protein